MAIEQADLREILLVLKDAGRTAHGNLLILGDVSIPISAPEFRCLVAETGFDCRAFPDEFTAATFGEALGFQSAETLDISGKASITHDLSEPPPAPLRQKYDMVIDAGVLFWCVNPGLVLKTIFEMLKPGGRVVHITGVSGFYGRGYCNVHPRLLEDFYALNGCRYLSSTFRTRAARASLLGRVRSYLSRRIGRRAAGDGEGKLGERCHEYGNVHLREDRPNAFRFGATEADRKPQYIPNEILGVLIFQKGEDLPAKLPVLTEDAVKRRGVARDASVRCPRMASIA